MLALWGFVLATFVLTDSFWLRLSKYPCQREGIVKSNETIDYLFLGNSRTMRSVDVVAVKDLIDQESGQESVVYNFARSWRSQMQLHTFLKDTLERRHVRTVVIEYTWEFKPLHRYAIITNRFFDLVEFKTHEEGRNFLKKVSKIFHWFIERHVYHFTTWLQPDKTLPEQRAFTHTCNPDEGPVLPHELIERKERYGRKLANLDKKFSPDRSNNKILSIYTRKMVNLAQSSGAKVVLLVNPIAYRKTLSESTRLEIEKYFGVPVLVPTEEVAQNLNEIRYYTDMAHLSREGRRIFEKWLIKNLVPQ